MVEGRQELTVSDGQLPRRVYDWARFDNRDTVWIRTRRGLELQGSTTHQLLLGDGQWRCLNDVRVGDRLQMAVSTNLWPKRPVRLHWRPLERMTLTDAAVVAGVSIDTILRFREGRRVRRAAAVGAAVAQYDQALSTLGLIQKRRRELRIPDVVDEDLAAFLGYLIGDGHISVTKRVIGLTTGDEEQADHFSELMEGLFAVKPRKRWDDGRWRVQAHSRTLEAFLVHLGLTTGVSARSKGVPDVVRRSPKPVVAAFLRALFDCDGYAGRQGVILSTSSTAMSQAVQLLLMNFGIVSSRRAHRDGCWHVHVTGELARCVSA